MVKATTDHWERRLPGLRDVHSSSTTWCLSPRVRPAAMMNILEMVLIPGSIGLNY